MLLGGSSICHRTRKHRHDHGGTQNFKRLVGLLYFQHESEKSVKIVSRVVYICGVASKAYWSGNYT